MNPIELQQHLAALHAELSQTTEVDDATREKLRDVIADIDRLIGPKESPSQAAGEAEPYLIEKLQQAMGAFEARHPQLTASVQQLIDRLSEIGI
jgi:ABC-type transporter Mla subunit MlaD